MLLSIPVSAHARLFREVIKQWALSERPHKFLLYTDDSNHCLGTLPPSNCTIVHLPRPGRWCSEFIWINCILARALRRDKITLFLSCYYKVPVLTTVARINMVHDVSFFLLASHLNAGRHRHWGFRVLLYVSMFIYCRLCRLTISVSEYSAHTVACVLRLSAKRLVACYNPVDTDFYSSGKPGAERASREYCLFVGSAIPKKNISGTVSAFSRLSPKLRRRYPLLLRTKPTAEVLAAVRSVDVDGTISIVGEHLGGDELAELIRGARLLVLLSYDEGFGLPVAEAMAAGVPVLVSNTGALQELTGGLGVDLSEVNENQIALFWERLMTDEHLRDDVIRRCKELAERFRPAAIAMRFEAILLSAVTGRE